MKGHDIYVLAEGGLEHAGDLARAKDLASAAKDAGAHGYKSQFHHPSEMVAREMPRHLAEKFIAYTLTLDEEMVLREHCKTIGIDYGITVYSPEAVRVLEYLEPDVVKIGSGEANNPFIWAEVKKHTGFIVASDGLQVGFVEQPSIALYCQSQYTQNSLDLLSLLRFRDARPKGQRWGYSAHTGMLWDSLMAAGAGATVFELHFSFIQHDFCVGVFQLGQFVSITKKCNVLYTPSAEVTEWAQHSWWATKTIRSGEIITSDNAAPKRPYKGLPVTSSILGLKAKQRIERDAPIMAGAVDWIKRAC